MSKKNFTTDQEAFWAGEFGTQYIVRNQSAELLASNLSFFSRALRVAEKIESCIEFGANVGMNLKALRLLLPACELHAIEINEDAVNALKTFLPGENVFHESMLEFSSARTWGMVLIKGVLIHINPESLPAVYDRIYESSSRYILLCEYYNPSPVSIPYRGYSEKLFKRDFAGEMLDRFSDLRLVDYGFSYRKDSKFPQDDITWFLMEKTVEGEPC